MPKRVGRWLRSHRWVAGLIVFLMIVVPGFVRIEQQDREQQQDMQCVSDWGDEYTARIEFLGDVTATRDAALDRLIRAVAMDDEATFTKALADYVEASDALIEAREENPLPEPPALQCE